jgi:hypothetical protein
VAAGTAIFSNSLRSSDLLEAGYQQAVIDHAIEYVNRNVHTNTMENLPIPDGRGGAATASDAIFARAATA